MAMVKLPKQFSPDFSRPGVKPAGPVEIDWSNPLTKGLRAAYLLQGSDLSDASKQNPIAMIGSNPTINADRNGQYRNFDGVDDYLDCGTGIPTLISTGPLTVISGVRATSTPSASAESIVGRGRDGSGGKRYNIAITDTQVVAQIDDNVNKSQINLSHAVVVGDFYQLSFVRNSGDFTVYAASDSFNGSDSTADITGDMGTMNGSPLLISSIDDSGGTPSKFFGGDVYYVYIFADDKSPRDINSLYLDPYQILKPAVPQFYFTAAGAVVDFTLAIDSGAYTLTGGTVDLAFDRIVSIDSGSYSLTGTDQELAFNRALQIDSGSYALTGTDVGLLFGAEFVLDIDSGSFNLTGEALTLEFNEVGGFTLPIDSGSFSLTGTDQELQFNRALSIDSGSYLLDGTDTTLRYDRVMAIDSGAYNLTGTEVTFSFNRAIILDNGEFNLFGADLTLSFSGELIGASDKHLINVIPQDRMVNVLTQDRLILVNYQG